MLRYVATALVAATLLAIALRSSGSGPAARTLVVPAGAPPAVESREVAGGRELRVTWHVVGSVSRAALVYEIGGERRTAAMETDCRRRLETGGRVSDDGYRTVVDLTGTIPEGATGVRLVVESETGTTEHPIQP